MGMTPSKKFHRDQMSKSNPFSFSIKFNAIRSQLVYHAPLVLFVYHRNKLRPICEDWELVIERIMSYFDLWPKYK